MKLNMVKENLKKEAKEIKELKIAMKNAMRGSSCGHVFQGKLSTAKYHWRHKHIAYCMLKGRKLEDIEKNSWKAGEPSLRLIEKYKEEFADGTN